LTIVVRCKHCGTLRTWEQLPDGSVWPPATDVGAGAKRYPYPCSVMPESGGGCAPIFATQATRIARELAGGIGARFSGRGGARKRR
jgi:hypothetical protein